MGFSDDFSISVSRWTEVRKDDITPDMGLEVLMDSAETGLCLVAEKKCNRLYIFNHVEYDSTSLADEYFRDIANGTPIECRPTISRTTIPDNKPLNRWRSHAFLLFGNWINQVYQTTPYDLSEIGKHRHG
jgi:homoserine O-succinyltransferase